MRLRCVLSVDVRPPVSVMPTFATFHPNPTVDDGEPWIERAALGGDQFRVWHVGAFCLAGFVAAVVMVCCCVKLRIPRTKQDIEANYQRKKLVSKFKARVKLIQNQEMDAMDLQRAMEIIQQDYTVAMASCAAVHDADAGLPPPAPHPFPLIARLGMLLRK